MKWGWFISMLIGVFIFGFTSTYFILKYTRAFEKTPITTPAPTFSPPQINFAPAPEITKEKGIYNSVLLGYGGAGHSGSMLTDSIIVIHIDTNKKTAALVSIPRDLWVNGNHKINYDAVANGFQNMGGVIKNVTGLPTDYFISIDFGNFVKLIDNLEGITVSVPKTFDDPFYPIAGLENEVCGKSEQEINELKSKYSDYQLEIQFTCRYEHLHFDKGITNLDGTTALKFVRSRHGDSDFGRSERQFAVLKGVLAKLITLNAFDKTSSTIKTLFKMVRTNLDLPSIMALIEAIGPSSNYKIIDIHLNLDNVLAESRSDQGAYILIPKEGNMNFDGIRRYISGSIQ